MRVVYSEEQTEGEAGCLVGARGSLSSLNLVITGKWRPGWAFGLEGLLRRRVPGQGLTLGALPSLPLRSLACAPS